MILFMEIMNLKRDNNMDSFVKANMDPLILLIPIVLIISKILKLILSFKKDDSCGCRELTLDEKKEYCKNTFYGDKVYDKITKASLIIDNNSCKPGPAPLGPPSSKQLVKQVSHNQNMINGKLIIETDVSKYSKIPYRLLLNWSRPNIDETGLTESEVALIRKIMKNVNALKLLTQSL